MLKLFPKLKSKRFREVNLDAEAKEWTAKNLGNTTWPSQSPLLNPKTCQAFVDSVHAKYKVDCSFGGYLEDRGCLWKGSYLENGAKFMHVGVDYNVPAGTKLSLDFAADVLLVDDDKDQQGGWGPRVILKPANGERAGHVMILAHLQNVLPTAGDHLKRADIFAEVGAPPHNGNWYAHLHVQAMELSEFYKILESGIYQLDGYGRSEEIEVLRSLYPNPEDVFASE